MQNMTRVKMTTVTVFWIGDQTTCNIIKLAVC